MRNTIGILSAALLVLLFIVWAPVGAEEEMCVPMGEITLEPLAPEAKRSSVVFPHAVHFDYNCAQCHHKWEQDAPIRGCTASGCHDLAEVPKNEEGLPVNDPVRQIRYFKNAYHQSCIGCHLDIAKANERIEASRFPGEYKVAPTGPTGCIECHPAE